MAVIAIPKSARARIVMAAGTDPQTGRAVSKSNTLSGLEPEIDGDKVYAVVDAAAAVLLYPVTTVETTVVNTLEKSI